MKNTFRLMLAALLCLAALTGCVGAVPAAQPEAPPPGAPSGSAPAAPEQGGPAMGDPEKKAILVVSFGTSYNDTRALTIDATEAAIAAAYPGYEVRRAFTSQMIIDKLAQRDGLAIDNVTQAMERLVADGVGALVVQPTHVMNGLEYEDMMAETAPFARHFASLAYGAPLLNSAGDYDRVAEILYAEYAPPADTALVLMGHGTPHFADSAYAALDYHFKALGHGNVFVGTVEGYPALEQVMEAVKAGGYRKVRLAPLMVVAGDHAANDMAGDEEDSWKIAFKSQGFQVEPLLKGMGEIEGIRQLYVDHVAAALNGPREG